MVLAGIKSAAEGGCGPRISMKVAALSHPAVPQETIQQFKCSPEIELTSEIHPSDTPDAALIFGGDGTVHRYLSQLYANKIPALVVPMGSGNDFAHTLGISSEKVALRAWKQFCAGGKNVRKIDQGVIRAEDQQILFCCVAGAGLDSDANARANRMPSWLRRSGGYLLAVLQTLFSYRAVEIEVMTEQRREKAPALLIAVGNAHRYGGGIKIVPRAELEDGLLDVCFVGKISKLKVFFCLPIIYFGGHTRLKEVAYFRARSVRIESTPALDLYADGELAGRTPVEISLLPQSLDVIVPE